MKKKLLIFFSVIILVFLSVFGYARYIGTKGLVVKEIKIINHKIPASFHGFKIAHLSDIHYGRTITEKELNNAITKVNLLKPDIVVLTGDLLDRDIKLSNNDIKKLIKILNKINPTIDKYAISGNHDFDYGLKDWLSIIEKSNFINLNDTYELIYKNDIIPILINGMSTNLRKGSKIQQKLEPFETFLNNDNDISPAYKIMIMHEPDFIDDFEINNFDLILAGHSHNGQVRLPFIGAIIKPNGAHKYYDSHYKIHNTDLYISSGLGTSIIDVRLFNKPSFNFYRLTNK